MKTMGNYVILTQKELTERAQEQYKDGKEDGKASSKARVESLEKALERKENLLVRTQRELEDTKAEVEVYEKERDDVRKVVKQGIENDDKAAILQAKKEGLDAREASLRDRENKVEDKESKAAKASYADGLADGLRKAHEITAKDRENAMKIAMVSAASHTPTETMKELNNVHQLTEGSSNS